MAERKKRIRKFFSSRLAISSILVIAEIVFIAVPVVTTLILWPGIPIVGHPEMEFPLWIIYFALYLILAIISVILLSGTQVNSAYKIGWAQVIILLPLVGAILYLIIGRRQATKFWRRRLYDPLINEISRSYEEYTGVRNRLENEDTTAFLQSEYIQHSAGGPVFDNTKATYYDSGEANFTDMLNKIREAKKYIFMEYFIINHGYMWDTILELLQQKVQEGVDVRLIYDDVGSIATLPKKYDKKLNSLGIKTRKFNPFVPIIKNTINTRNHRKILVIDGHTAFTGGINIADEYINHINRFGHWKDSGIMLEGRGAFSFTIMFLSLWNTITGIKENYKDYEPVSFIAPEEHIRDDGYVQPFCDYPNDDEPVGENIYLNMIAKAKKTIYITTPYLILSGEMATALKNAAKQGIDVRIVVPGIPDKKMVYVCTKSYFRELIRAGIKIYTYTPGFIHAKNFMVDNTFGTIGTVNLDFRSLYLHMECGVWLYKNPILQEMTTDFEKLIKVSHLVSPGEVDYGTGTKLKYAIIRIFAPML